MEAHPVDVRLPPPVPHPDYPTSSAASTTSRAPSQRRQTPAHESKETPDAVTGKPALKRLAWLDQLLALWILIAMAVGIVLGEFVPQTQVVLEKVQFVNVSLPLAIALIIMMWPILCRVSPVALLPLFRRRSMWQHLAFSIFINWIVSPLLMLGLAWAFLPDRPELREGLIIVGVARCIAMVLVWTDIADGDVDYCAVLVAFNSILQIVLFSPVALLFIKVFKAGGSHSTSDFQINYSLVSKSVAAFLGIPFGAAMLTRAFFTVIRAKTFFERKFLPAIAPLSLIALLFTILIIFAAQGHHVVGSITDVLRVAAPLIVYFIIMFFAVLFLCRRVGVSYQRTATQAFTAASNNFELAVSVTIATWGAQSPQALASTVGPLVEVPVLLALAYLLVWVRRRMKWDLPDPDLEKRSPSATDAKVDEEGSIAVGERSRPESLDKADSLGGAANPDNRPPSDDSVKVRPRS